MEVPVPHPPDLKNIINEMTGADGLLIDDLERQLGWLMNHPEVQDAQLVHRLEEVNDALQEIRAEIRGLQQYVVDLLEQAAAKNGTRCA